MSERSRRLGTAWKVIAFLVVVTALAVLARQAATPEAMTNLDRRVASLGPWGPLAFGLAYAVATIALLPGAPLTIAAGATFGPVLGAAVASTGATVGAAGAFLIARHLARDAVASAVGRDRRWSALDAAIERGGWKVVALLRLSPAVPFNVQNYLYGLTAIRFWPCVLTSWVAMLPGAFLYASIGAAGRVGLEAATGGVTRSRSPLEWSLLALGLIATFVVTWYVGRLASRVLAEAGKTDHPVA
ncbi:MAG: TVP38/TMEM64 family protein [Isosphaeraceae bacterium]